MEGTFQVGKWMASMGRSGCCCCIYWGSTCRSSFDCFEWWTSATRGFYTVLVFEKHFWHDFVVTGLFDCKIPTDSWILYSIFFLVIGNIILLWHGNIEGKTLLEFMGAQKLMIFWLRKTIAMRKKDVRKPES